MLAMHFGTIFDTRLYQVKKTQKLQRFYNQRLTQKGLLVENTLQRRCMIIDFLHLTCYTVLVCFSVQLQLNA